MWRSWVLGMVACGPGLQGGEPREVAQRSLLDAAGDAASIQRLLAVSVVNAGLYFTDAGCARQFSAIGEIRSEQFAAFARCLAGLHLQASDREDALGDVAVLTYAPGIELEARVAQELTGPRLGWIGYASRVDDRDSLPTISRTAFEALRVSGTPDAVLAPEVAAKLQGDRYGNHHGALTWLKVCLDAAGAVTRTQAYERSSLAAAEAFAAVARTWQFRPFAIGGQPVPVCSMVRMTFPVEHPHVERLPMPPPPSRAGQETIVFAEGSVINEAKRISGRTNVTPDDRIRVALRDRRQDRLIGEFRLCLDDAGHVESVLPMRSTGYADYDRELMFVMRTWIYSPVLIDGRPAPVCTSITFNYSQR